MLYYELTKNKPIKLDYKDSANGKTPTDLTLVKYFQCSEPISLSEFLDEQDTPVIDERSGVSITWETAFVGPARQDEHDLRK